MRIRLSLRAFLGYGLDEKTPNHSSLSVIRSGLWGPEVFWEALELVLKGTLRLRVAQGAQSRHRLVGHWSQRVAPGIAPPQYRGGVLGVCEGACGPGRSRSRRYEGGSALRQEKPGRKTSNKEWFNPYDAEAKVQSAWLAAATTLIRLYPTFRSRWAMFRSANIEK